MLVRDRMTSPAITVSPETDKTTALRTMYVHKIHRLPVVDRGQVVGIITESDIFDAFLELLGARHEGARVVVPLPDIADGVARALAALRPTGARLVGLTTYRHEDQWWLVLTADEKDPRDLVRALSEAGFAPTSISVGPLEAESPGHARGSPR